MRWHSHVRACPVLPKGGTVVHIPWKRSFDILFSLTVMTLASPLYLSLALLIKCSSKGPVTFAHERIGRGGRSFPCYKFRSMIPDAESVLEELLKNDPLLKKEWDTSHKLKKDPRITRIGQFLRRSSLDELPQFWNVLVGDMSIVGARALVKEEFDKYVGDRSAKILSQRPGITGLWQVSGRSNTSYAQRIALDEKYIDNCNFFSDLWIIAKTIPVMLFGSGAY